MLVHYGKHVNRKLSLGFGLLLVSFFLEGCDRSKAHLQYMGIRTMFDNNVQITKSILFEMPNRTSVVLLPATDVIEMALTRVSMKRLRNEEIKYSLLYPDEWQIRGQVVATEFANSSQCESVEVVDFQPPPGSGAGFILRSFVQICAKPLTDSLTLDGFMRQTYGGSTTQFQVTDLAGRQAYRSVNAERSRTWFLQTNKYRIQIVTAVVANPDKQDMRFSQVKEILASLSFQ